MFITVDIDFPVTDDSKGIGYNFYSRYFLFFGQRGCLQTGSTGNIDVMHAPETGNITAAFLKKDRRLPAILSLQ